MLRVPFADRLGTDPRTKLTPKGKFVMEFPVAVAVEVIAYEHLKTKSDPATGRRHEVREYYATTVTPKPRAGEPASEALHRPCSSSSR